MIKFRAFDKRSSIRVVTGILKVGNSPSKKHVLFTSIEAL